jgi:hypothetical protein
MTHYAQQLEGKTISSVHTLSSQEIHGMYWNCHPDETTVLEFTDGTFAIVMCDPEGNDTGHLYIHSRNIGRKK